MDALVTGCAGFIGSHLVDSLLNSGYKVLGIDCFSDYYSRDLKEKNILLALENKNFQLIEKDIMTINDFPSVDYVFHLAAQAGVRGSWGKNFQIYSRNNIEVTQRLLEIYKDKSIKKFVYSSSSSVYGDSTLPMKEASLLRPVSPYGVTKLAAENLCYLYWKNYNIPTVSLRYFTVYGPRQRPDMAINKFVRSVISGEKLFIYGGGSQTRDFTYVDDVINANILSAKKECSGQVLNIAGGARININELISKIEEILGKKANIENINEQMGDVADTWADISKANEVLGWTPKQNIKSGLENYVEYILNGVA